MNLSINSQSHGLKANGSSPHCVELDWQKKGFRPFGGKLGDQPEAIKHGTGRRTRALHTGLKRGSDYLFEAVKKALD